MACLNLHDATDMAWKPLWQRRDSETAQVLDRDSSELYAIPTGVSEQKDQERALKEDKEDQGRPASSRW